MFLFKGKFTFCVIAICTALISSCTDTSIDAPPDGEPTKSIMPLQTGNTWNYKIFYIDPVSGSREDSQKDYTTTVDAEITLSGERWFTVSNFHRRNSEFYLQSKIDGLWLHTDVVGSPEQLLFFKYPAAANSTFTNPVGTWTVISTSEVVESGGISYTCYHYKAPNFSEENSDMHFYVAPGVGLVKSVFTTTMETKVYDVSQELQSYNLR